MYLLILLGSESVPSNKDPSNHHGHQLVAAVGAAEDERRSIGRMLTTASLCAGSLTLAPVDLACATYIVGGLWFTIL
jgi:hypothetical protein